MTQNIIKDCILMELTNMNQKVSEALIKKFGKIRYIAIDDIVNFDNDEVINNEILYNYKLIRI